MPDRNKRLSRRDALAVMFTGGLGLIAANSWLGRRISELDPYIPRVDNSLSEYSIAWDAKPWVWANLSIASELLNGQIIEPGQEMSVISALKLDQMEEVSRANTDPSDGYVAAQMSQGIDGWGYGLCLASTSLFRAALDSPLLVTERATHFDIYPDYFSDLPIGTDAAIYEPDPGDNLPKTDLKFLNPTMEPVSLRFEVFDESGEKIKVPEEALPGFYYKGAYLDWGVNVARRELSERSGFELPPQFLPEYSFGNKRIVVQAAVVGTQTDYDVHTSSVEQTNTGEYYFTRTLELGRQASGGVYKESFISQYNRDPNA